MDQTTMDILYFGFLALVIIGGIVAIAILAPKENKLRMEKKDCYRFIEKQGELFLSNAKPSLFEKKNGYIYIEKGPFEIDAFFDDVTGADKKSYRAGAVLQLYLPERSAEKTAKYLYSILSSFNQDSINAVITAEVENILMSYVKKHSADKDIKKTEKAFSEEVSEKLAVFGYELYCPLTLKISENEQKA